MEQEESLRENFQSGKKKKEINVPAVVRSSSLGSEAFDPANKLISGGLVQLNIANNLLKNIPDEAIAEILWFPRSTAEIVRDDLRDLGAWIEDISDIRGIDESHGFHARGELVTGMQIFDCYEKKKRYEIRSDDKDYQEEHASVLMNAWKQAKSLGQNVMTGAAIVTPELIHGYSSWDYRKKVLKNNLRDQVTTLNAEIRRQNTANGISREVGRIITEASTRKEGSIVLQPGSIGLTRQFTSAYRGGWGTQNGGKECIDMEHGIKWWADVKKDRLTSRPAVLRVLAPKNP